MNAKRLALLAGLLIALGCSSTSTLFAHNDSPSPIDLAIIDDRGEQFDARLEPGDSVEAYHRFGSFTGVKFKVDGRELTAEESPIPHELASNGSDGLYAHWHWDGARAVIDVERLSNFGRMAMGYLVAFAVILGLIIFALVRKANRLREAHLGG